MKDQQRDDIKPISESMINKFLDEEKQFWLEKDNPTNNKFLF